MKNNLRSYYILWDLESIGITDKETVHESFERNVSFEKGRYHVKLPLKEKHDILPDHYDLSLARLDSQVKRLRQKPKAKVYLRNTIRYLKSN
jgi:hypothetical protein